MSKGRRERLVIDLGHLGPKLKALATSHGLTASEVTRRALAAHLAPLCLEAEAESPSAGEPPELRSVKVSVRMRGEVAASLAAASQASGVSQGIYIGSLLAARPAPPLEIAAALGRSTDQLAVTLTDLNEVIRILERSGPTSSAALEGWLKPLGVDLRAHLDIAAKLMMELRTGTAAPREIGQKAADTEGASA